MGIQTRRSAPLYRLNCHGNSIVQRANRPLADISGERFLSQPQKAEDHWLMTLENPWKEIGKSHFAGRLGEDGDDFGSGIGIESIQRGKEGDAAHGIRKVPAADADGLRNSRARPMDEGSKFLDSRAGCPDDADRAATNNV